MSDKVWRDDLGEIAADIKDDDNDERNMTDITEKYIIEILKDYVLVNKDAWKPLIFQGKLVFDPNSVNRKKVAKAILEKIKEENEELIKKLMEDCRLYVEQINALKKDYNQLWNATVLVLRSHNARHFLNEITDMFNKMIKQESEQKHDN